MSEDFTPEKMIVVYKQGYYEGKYYIEIHDVKETQNGIEIGSGSPLNRSMMSDIIGATSDDDSSYFNNGLLDPMILSCEPKKHKRYIMWYSKPKNVKMLFNKERSSHKSGTYSMPGLLHLVIRNKFYVYAIRCGNNRPTLDTKIYHPPLYNFGADSICMGSVKNNSDKIININDEILFWEGVLWNSQFNNDGGPKLKKPVKEVYKSIYNGKNKFPGDVLVDTKLTIRDLIRKT